MIRPPTPLGLGNIVLEQQLFFLGLVVLAQNMYIQYLYIMLIIMILCDLPCHEAPIVPRSEWHRWRDTARADVWFLQPSATSFIHFFISALIVGVYIGAGITVSIEEHLISKSFESCSAVAFKALVLFTWVTYDCSSGCLSCSEKADFPPTSFQAFLWRKCYVLFWQISCG